MRLDALCAESLGISRAESRNEIRSKKITVNGICVTKPDTHVSRSDDICRNGEALDLRERLYFMLNKPSGFVSTTDPIPESVLNLFPERYRTRLFCVGRLDKDTTGLLLLTDDGEFSHRITSPKRQVPKEYAVTLAEPLSDRAKAEAEAGLTLANGEIVRPCRIEPDGERHCKIILDEGKYHEVKRIFAAVGNRVTALHRNAIGSVLLDPALAPGQYRELTEEERKILGAK